MNGEQKMGTIVTGLVCAVLIAFCFNVGGCNETASVTCANGVTYSTQEWGGEPDLSPKQAQELCQGKGH